jgi:flagellar biosynthesis/type III secretory pathway chaperone
MVVRQPGDEVLANEVLVHLDEQLVAARRLLQVVLEQGVAIRRRDVRGVVELTAALQAELQRRAQLEANRASLLQRAGTRLGVAGASVTLSLIESLMDDAAAERARALSSELRGLLEVVQREHYCNRALMSQELAFLDHLLRLTGMGGETGYSAGGDRVATSAAQASGHRMLDLAV